MKPDDSPLASLVRKPKRRLGHLQSILCGILLGFVMSKLLTIDMFSDQKHQPNPPPNDGDVVVDSFEKFLPWKTTAEDANCARLWEWTTLDDWAESERDDKEKTKDEEFPQEFELQQERSGAPSSTGIIHMRISVNTAPPHNLTVVDCRFLRDVFSGNVWHRMVPQYASWVALQIAQRKYHLQYSQTVFLLDCAETQEEVGASTTIPISQGWSNLGTVTCQSAVLEHANVIITPPNDGLLWDLAWDHQLQCSNSTMFRAFVENYVTKDSSQNRQPVGCYISRQRRNQRVATNYEEVLDLMRQVFRRVRVLDITERHTTEQIEDLLYECRVLVGVHGAGLMNSLWARPGVSVIELSGKIGAAYYRNINMLLGQYYESIPGDDQGTMSTDFTIDLEQLKPVLERGRDHAEWWYQQHGGNWR